MGTGIGKLCARFEVYLAGLVVVLHDCREVSLTFAQILELGKPFGAFFASGGSPRAYVGSVSIRPVFGQVTVRVWRPVGEFEMSAEVRISNGLPRSTS